MKNPVKKYSDKFNKPKVEPDKKKRYKRKSKHKEKPNEKFVIFLLYSIV